MAEPRRPTLRMYGEGVRRTPEKDPDSDPGGTNPDFHVHLPRKVTGRQIIALVTSLLALIGSGWWAKEKLTPDSPVVMVSKAWQVGVERDIADLRGKVDSVLSKVDASDNATAALRAEIRTHMIVGLYRERWIARQAGDQVEAGRIQAQIDKLEVR